MAAIDFPASPTTDQLFSVAATGVTYRWNGTLWLVQAGPGGGTGDFCANQTSSFPTIDATARTMILTQVISGNSGNWYSTSTGRYTPPAGRYYIHAGLSSYYSSGGVSHFTIWLLKNGTIFSTSRDSTATSGYCDPQQAVIVDANGTDYFEMQAQSNAGIATPDSITFLAFPLTGMQGPTGAPGLAGQSLLLYWSAASAALAGALLTFGWDVVGENTTGGSYTSGSGLFTIPTGMGGLWNVSFCMQLTGTATVGLMALRVNAADVANVASPATNSNGVSMSLNGSFRFAAGDVVSARVMGTGATTAYGTSASTNRASWLHLTRVGA